MFYVYILYSGFKDKYYIGYTSDLKKRLAHHNSGNGFSKFTKQANDWKVVYEEKFANRSSAMEREKIIKKKKSRKYIEWLINSNLG